LLAIAMQMGVVVGLYVGFEVRGGERRGMEGKGKKTSWKSEDGKAM
jgi:hypothetical protein